MSKLHDDLTSRADKLLDSAKKAAALETEQQQGLTDVMNKLDEAYKILDQMLSDNAASGSSTGGGSGAQTANAAAPQPPDQPMQGDNPPLPRDLPQTASAQTDPTANAANAAAAVAPQPQAPDQPKQEPSQTREQPAKAQGWKP
jgi:hypothetical protein